jgi:hypothetical protein
MTFTQAEPIAVFAFAAVVLTIRVRTGHAPRWWRRRRWQRATGRSGRRGTAGRTFGLVSAVLAVAILPWPAYLALRPHVRSDAEALAIVCALPLTWTLAHWIRRHRIDLLGLITVAVYGCAVALSATFGDSPMPLKLRDAGVLGVVGLACVGSVVVRRPLLLVALRHLSRRLDEASGKLATRLDDPGYQQNLSAATAVAGVIFLLAALADAVLIVATSTATFLAFAGLVGGLAPIVAAIAAAGLLRVRAPGRDGPHRR